MNELPRRVSIVVHELLTLLEHLSSPAVLVGFVLLGVCRLLLVLFLLVIVLSVLRFTELYYTFGILKLFLSGDGDTGHDRYEKKVKQ